MSDYNIYEKREPMEFDPVNRPKHYNQGKIEVLDMIKDQSTPEGYEGYLINNVRKYTARYKFKNGLEDLKKAQFYLNKIIKEYESGYLK